MKKYITISLLLFFVACFAQAPTIDWMKSFGGIAGDYLSSGITTQDGGYLLAGSSFSGVSGNKTCPLIGNNNDFWVVKLNSTFDIEWQTEVEGGDSWAFTQLRGEFLTCVSQAADGSYYLGGYSDSPIYGNKSEPNYGDFDYWIVKISSTGQFLWDKTLGGDKSDRCYSIATTLDGGCIVEGESFSGISGNKTESCRGNDDCWIIKLNPSGSIDWQKTLGGSGNELPGSIKVFDDGSYLLSIESNSDVSGDKTEPSKGVTDCWLLKLDALGNIIWQKSIGGSGLDGLGYALTLSDGYILCGSSNSNISGDKTENSKGGFDSWIVKIDFEGNVIWDRTYGGSGDEGVSGLIVCPDGGFVYSTVSNSTVSGDKTEASFGGQNGQDAWIVRLDNAFNIVWDKTIGGNGDDTLGIIADLSDNSFVLAGSSFSSISGNITIPFFGGSTDYWLVKLNPENLSSNNFVAVNYNVYPNPTSGSVNIKCKELQENIKVSVYNSLSQKVKEVSVSNANTISFFLEGTMGIYFLKIENDNGDIESFKIIRK